MQKYPYIILTVILIVVLWGPFVLKLKDPRLEPYPAVIFPSGASVLNKNEDEIVFYSSEIYGYRDSSFVKIEKEEFFKNIPLWYYNEIKKSGFGLKNISDTFKLYKPPIEFVNSNRFSEESKLKTIEWIKERLNESKVGDSVFYIRTYRSKLKSDSEYLYTEMTDEEAFELY